MAKKKYKIVDLFCGCGGMTLGMEKAGYNVLAGFDIWKPAIDVYKANFKHPVIQLDLSDVKSSVKEISKYDEDVKMYFNLKELAIYCVSESGKQLKINL